MPDSKRRNSSGSAYSTLEWLSNHYSIKSEGRFEFIAGLPILPGDKVLDLGCANGAWARIIAERVGINGSVCGIDRDPELVHHATKTHRNNHLSQRLSFDVLDIETDVFPLGFNIIVAFNTISLTQKPLSVFRKIHSYIKENRGLFIIKDSALSSDFYWPIDKRIREEISVALSSGARINGYDPDFALTCRKYLRDSGFKISETRLKSYAFMYPFGKEQKVYISQNAKMIQELKPAHIKLDMLDSWINTEMAKDGNFFSDPDSIYTTTEFAYICHAT
uniref:Methyltransferase domain-containing protein n=1 Tax=Candidatus Kentrum sp. UNK TaxID=2126344 RepID=A0A451AWQ3_9GAMM|nr:MAG: Methyltransferase domain-containing protein [Candidatus Kentron sp. UNK]VFK70458.1 MAG: Methyltransferase domain-containing protein [Candidatus Kentron sp. UNK]